MVKPVGHGEVFMRFKFGHLILGLIGKRFNELREHFDFDGLFIQDAEVIDDRATGGRVYQQSQHCTSRHIKEKLCNLKKKKKGGRVNDIAQAFRQFKVIGRDHCERNTNCAS